MAKSVGHDEEGKRTSSKRWNLSYARCTSSDVGWEPGPAPIKHIVVTFPSSTFMSKLDFKKAVEQEEARLRLLHPTPADIPGCISVFDDYLGCSGMLKIQDLSSTTLLTA